MDQEVDTRTRQLDQESSASRPDMYIAVRDLVVAYGGAVAVHGISFDVPSGQQITLLGPSGCGKSTTLRAIAGLEQPLSGEIKIGGKVVYSSVEGINIPAEKRDLAMVFQSYAIWPHMSVIDNVVYGLKVRHVKSSELRPKGMSALRLVQMEEYADRSAAELSGGQQQRVAVARSLAYSPSVVLFDEPLSNLDAKLRESMRVELKLLQQHLNVTALYVTHDQEEALAMSDRVAVMDRGKIVQFAPPNVIYDKPASEFVARFIGTANIFPGTVSRIDEKDEVVEISVDGDRHIAANMTRTVALNAPVSVCVQSAYVELSRERPDVSVNCWTVQVKLAVFNGDSIQYFIDWNGDEVTVKRSPIEVLTAGEKVYMYVNPAKCSILTAETSSVVP